MLVCVQLFFFSTSCQYFSDCHTSRQRIIQNYHQNCFPSASKTKNKPQQEDSVFFFFPAFQFENAKSALILFTGGVSIFFLSSQRPPPTRQYHRLRDKWACGPDSMHCRLCCRLQSTAFVIRFYQMSAVRFVLQHKH